MSPSLSSSGAIARAAISPPSADRSMTSTQVILISFGVFVASGIFLCVWRRIFNMRTFRFLYALVRPNPQDSHQEGKNAGDPENGHPKMSDTWIERCITRSLRWEEYMPCSARVFTSAETKNSSDPVRKVGKCRGDGTMEERGGTVKGQGSCCLQVGVLVAMPSPRAYNDGVGQGQPRSPVRGGLAIGLIEMPWTEEDLRRLEKIAS